MFRNNSLMYIVLFVYQYLAFIEAYYLIINASTHFNNNYYLLCALLFYMIYV